MAKHQIFLVHGMGSFQQGWSDPVKQQLLDIFSNYENAKELGDDIDFVEITYNNIFEDWRQQWKEDATAAAAAATQLGLDGGIANQLISLAKAPTGDSFFQTHVFDVVMYRYFPQASQAASQSVRKQILGRLNSFPQNDLPHWSVIAHSLGTAVTNDTLHAMFTQPVDGALLSDYFRPYYLFMVANVSKILWNKRGDFYASEVYPHDSDTKGMCYKYGNYHHELDFIARADPFNPPADRFPPHLYDDVKIDAADIQEWNVHDLSHYLSHPAVHASIIRTLRPLWPDIISAQEYSQALAKWRAGSLRNTALAKAQQKLEDYLTGNLSDWTNLIQQLIKYRSAVMNNQQN